MAKSKLNHKAYLDKVAELEEHAKKYADEDFYSWPTIKAAAKIFGVSQKTISFMVDDSDKLDIVAGYRSGGGVAEFSQADQRIEYYEEGIDG